ncbi:MAG: hypothetical protein K6F73_01540 [Lachnospiraceae bacterium]|nr:hypothetical protein [Lachnospiraceae bacterium]
MAAVLLTILKITGIVLLALIGLILLILSLILFVPIRYKITAKRDDPSGSPYVLAKVTYLLHIASGCFEYDEKTDKWLKIFGIKVWPKKEKKEKKKDRKEETGEAYKESDKEETVPEINEEITEDDFAIDWNDEDKEAEGFSSSDGPDESDEKDITDKISEIIDSISEKYESLCDKYKGIKSNIHFWKKMADDSRNKEAMAVVKKQVIRLLRKLAPRKVKGFVHFGFDDPATTGKVLMYLSLVYPILPKKLWIDPGFEDTDIYGNILIKGHIALIVPAVCFLKLMFNKDCKRMWRLYKRHSEK